MPLPKVIPALADLTQDIAGPLPVRLLTDWATGAQDLDAASGLLSAFEIDGTVVSTDTSGLSRMTQAMDLLDVINVVSRPKEIVHALGRAIGGRGIGTWVADNTEMIFPSGIEPETIVDTMGEVQTRIEERLPIRIGMCIHKGRFFEIGGGLYGRDADVVEYLAENCAGGGEILLTDSVLGDLSVVPADLEAKVFTEEALQLQAWLLKSKRRMPHLEERETAYPHPFPAEFYALLPRLNNAAEATELKQMIYSRWLRERVVVFIALHRDQEDARSLSGLLDALVENALMETVVRDTAPQDSIASSAGGIAIVTFAGASEALDYARTAQARLAANGLPVRVAIDTGPVLLFQNSHGPSGITGDPINIASKLSEDTGRTGRISVSARAARQLGGRVSGENFEIRISGVVLAGMVLN